MEELLDIFAKDDNLEPQALCSYVDGHVENEKKPADVITANKTLLPIALVSKILH